MESRMFSPSDDVAIDNEYPLHGSRWDGWQTRLSRRFTAKQISNQAGRLGVPYFGSPEKAWNAFHWLIKHKWLREMK